MPIQPRIPIPTLLRLAGLYRVAYEAERDGKRSLNSAEIEHLSGVSAAQVRKDLSLVGEIGTPGVGYDVSLLREQIGQLLKLDRGRPYALVGAGHLGQALAGYPGFGDYGFRLAAIFDSDPNKVGTCAGDNVIEDVATLPARLAELGLRYVAIAVPASAAQEVCDLAIQGGARWIINFTPSHLKIPADCVVRDVNMTQEFAVLSYFTEP
jgi:redox-sensing transcriptional repressor